MKIGLAQIDTTIGDFSGNAERIVERAHQAKALGAGLVVFPELTICGYPPKDLVEIKDFVDEQRAELERLAVRLKDGSAVLVGYVEASRTGRGIGRFNSAAWLEGGRIRTSARKCLLPNYDVFDEKRYFDPSSELCLVDHQGLKLGITICEDVWNDPSFWRSPRYEIDPIAELKGRGASWIVNLSASPYSVGKSRLREEMLRVAARRHGVGFLLANLVGGNDQLIFDGNSFAVGKSGEVLLRLQPFAEDLGVVDLTAAAPTKTVAPVLESIPEDEILDALTLGLRDYARKTGFKKAVVGISGGIDSALVAVIAARALGPDNVLGVAMPSRFTAAMSNEDSQRLARILRIAFEVIPIEPMVDAFRTALKCPVDPRGSTDENLQARVRGMILMAISNQRGHLVISTGNKSELAVGYCTLYGDMAGGLAVIGDLPKMWVLRLCRRINEKGEVIPARVLERPPSAELRDHQKDEDSLPPYEDLDRVLEKMVLEKKFGAKLLASESSRTLVEQVEQLLLRAEYKRQQAAPTLKVTGRAFGDGWRFPIAHRWNPSATKRS